MITPIKATISNTSPIAPAIKPTLLDPPLGALFAAGAADGCSSATVPGDELCDVATSAL